MPSPNPGDNDTDEYYLKPQDILQPVYMRTALLLHVKSLFSKILMAKKSYCVTERNLVSGRKNWTYM